MNIKRLLFLAILISWGSVLWSQENGNLLTYKDASGNERPVRTIAEWQLKRAQILKGMELIMGDLPARDNLPPLEIRYLDSVAGIGYTRFTISFTAAKDEPVTAFLYVPHRKNMQEKRPAMLALHETDPIGKRSVDAQGRNINLGYAKELAERGYVVIAPDYPGFGDAKDYDFRTDRYESGTMKAIFNNIRCVDLLQERADVDSDKIGVIGHSLGGHNAIFTGAFDERLKVVVSSCGWTLFHDYFNGDSAAMRKYGGKLWAWAQERYMPRIKEEYDLDPDKLPVEFDEIIAAIAPRAFFSSSPVNDANFNNSGVKKGMDSIAKIYELLEASQNLKAVYPDSKHDFPFGARWQAYRFIDSVLNYHFRPIYGYSFLSNYKYLERMEFFSLNRGQKDIVFLGNSLTERGDWEKITGRTDVSNRGIGSDITEGFINRIQDVFYLKPRICFIEGGVNDLGRQIAQDTIIRNLGIIIDTLRSEGIIPVLNMVTYLTDYYKWHQPAEFNQRIKELNKAIKALAKKKKVRLINLNPMISDGKFLLEKYAIADGIHYTDATYQLWRDEIFKILVKNRL